MENPRQISEAIFQAGLRAADPGLLSTGRQSLLPDPTGTNVMDMQIVLTGGGS